jgi:HIP---CoA ligase
VKVSDVKLTAECRSIPDMVRVNGVRFANRPAVVGDDAVYSYAGLAAEMQGVARGLLAIGVQRGDRVAIWAPNSARWITAALGALAVGAWLTPLNSRLSGPEAAVLLRRVDAAALFTVRDFLDRDFVAALRAADPSLPVHGRTFALDHDPESEYDYQGLLRLGREVPAHAVDASIDGIAPGDVADVIHTSGTTGEPKGILLTHGQSLRGYASMNDICLRLGPQDRHLVVPPFSHCFGYKAGWLVTIMVGGTVFPLPVFDPADVVARVERERITVLQGPPTVFTDLLAVADGHDLSSLRTVFVGATSITPELLERIRQGLGVMNVLTGYGLTEATALVALTSPDDPPHIASVTSGRPMPGVEVAAVDARGQPSSPEEPGEILVRGYTVSTGYFGRDAPPVTDADGWLHTGDLGLLRADGYLRITGRKKDMYIVGGFNVYPAEVERCLLQLHGVREAAVVGVADQRLGEVGCAFVVPERGTEISAAEVTDWAAAHLAGFKVPSYVHVVPELPKNATGKVRTSELRALAADTHQSQLSGR